MVFGFLFGGNKPKFQLKENMEVELELMSPDGPKSYFTKVLEVSKKKATFQTPKENNKFVAINPQDMVKVIALIDGVIFQVNAKVVSALDREFEALLSSKEKSYDTPLKDKKGAIEGVKLEAEVPLDFRAISTSHLQKAVTKSVCRESVEMVTNLPVPEGTDLKVNFRIPESPVIETEGRASTSESIEGEDSKKSKTLILFPDKVLESDMAKSLFVYVLHYQRRLARRKEMEDAGEIPKKEGDAPLPAARKTSKVRKKGKLSR